MEELIFQMIDAGDVYYDFKGSDHFHYYKGNKELTIETLLPVLNEWLKERREIGLTYIKFLKELGIDIDSESVLEVGKTAFDTLTEGLKTRVSTPHAELFTKDKTFVEGLLVDEYGNVKENSELEKYGIDLVITQNPYDKDFIHKWDKIHNSGKKIVLGMYGKEKDHDKIYKLCRLDLFTSFLDGDYINEEYSNGKVYCKVIASKK